MYLLLFPTQRILVIIFIDIINLKKLILSSIVRTYSYSSACYSDQQVLKEYLISWLRQVS